jgi:hypothetical protein
MARGNRRSFFEFRKGFCKGLLRSIPIFSFDGEHSSQPGAVMMRGTAVRRELSVLALLKGNERYVYVYDDDSRTNLINVFRDQAADPRLSLSWLDVGILSNKARAQAKTAADEPPAESRI